MNEENNKLKLQIINLEDDLFLSNYALNRIEKLIKEAIIINIKKTQKIAVPKIVKIYREQLLVLREVEQELIDWHERTFQYRKR